MISVSLDGERDNAGELARQHKTRFPVIYDPDGEVAKLNEVTAIPLNVVIDPKGNVDEVILGANAGALKSAAERLAKPTNK